ncbi:hypothetical protein [Mycobacterium intracellulare]|uniref:hypothetical protein n=1 Tax=Mycobacterium intracellulare TaxID=1767 RepID=UPI0019289352|nr:hypothetical protein [Mycobacterium intracellulare]
MSDTQTVDRDQRVRMNRALRRLPYSGLMAGAPSPDQPNFVDAVCDYLEAIADIQRGYADEATAAHNELLQLRRERQAIRDFLGVSGQ